MRWLADAVGGAPRQFGKRRHACFALIRSDSGSALTLPVSAEPSQLCCNTVLKAMDGRQRLSRGDLCSAFELQQQFEKRQSPQHLKAGRHHTCQSAVEKRR